MPKVIQKPEDKAAQPPGSPVGLSRSTSSGKTDAAEAGQDSHWLPKRSSVAQLLGSHLASAALAKIKEHDDAAAAGNKRESMQGLQGAGLVSKNKSVFDESKMQAAISETEEAVAQEEVPTNLGALSLEDNTVCAEVQPDDEIDARRLTMPKIPSAGIGVRFRKSTQGIRILTIMPGGPAETSGLLQVDDVVTEIDGMKTKPLGISAIIGLLCGPEGSDCKLIKLEAGTETPITVTRSSGVEIAIIPATDGKQ